MKRALQRTVRSGGGLLAWLVALVCLAPGPGEAGAALTVFGEGWKVRLPSPPAPRDPAWDAAARLYRLAGARNEVVAFQVMVDAGTGTLGKSLSVTTRPLAGEGGAPAIPLEVFRQRVVKVTVPSRNSARSPVVESGGTGWYPAQLTPLADGAPVEPRAYTEVFWVDVTIPRDAAAGTYRGELSVRGLPDGDQTARIELTVVDFTLPDELNFASYGYFGQEYLPWAFPGRSAGALQAIERAFFRMARRHRLNLVANLEPSGPEEDLEAWWRRYGPYVEGSAFTDGPGKGAPAPLWTVWIGAQEEAAFKAAVGAAVGLFARKGFPGVPVLYVADEPGTREAYEMVRRRCRWAKEAVGRALPCMVTDGVTPRRPAFGSLVGFVDIWNSGAIRPEEMAARRAAGERVWVNNAGGPYGGPWYLDTPLSAIHRWGWGAWRYGIQAWHLWNTNYWVDKHNLRLGSRDIARAPGRYLAGLWDEGLTFDETRRQGYRHEWAMRLNGDGVMFYPGAPAGIEGPVATPQLKAFRRAAQDYEYLRLLSQRGGDEAIAEVLRVVHPAFGRWEADPAAWNRARDAVRSEIVKRQAPRQGTIRPAAAGRAG